MRSLLCTTPALTLAAGLALAAPAAASRLQPGPMPCAHTATGCASGRPHAGAPGAPDASGAPDIPGSLLAEPRIDLPDPLPMPGDDQVLLAASETLVLELPDFIAVLFEPGWEDLDERHQQILAPFAPEWNTWPMAEKRSWLAFADRMQDLPEDQRRRARHRILEWANMSPEERRIARLNHQSSRRRPMPERVKEWERYRSFSYAERERLRHSEEADTIAAAQRARALGALPPGTEPPAAFAVPPVDDQTGGRVRVIILPGLRLQPGEHLDSGEPLPAAVQVPLELSPVQPPPHGHSGLRNPAGQHRPPPSHDPSMQQGEGPQGERPEHAGPPDFPGLQGHPGDFPPDHPAPSGYPAQREHPLPGDLATPSAPSPRPPASP